MWRMALSRSMEIFGMHLELLNNDGGVWNVGRDMNNMYYAGNCQYIRQVAGLGSMYVVRQVHIFG